MKKHNFIEPFPRNPFTVHLTIVTMLVLIALQIQAGEPENRGQPLSYWLEQYRSGNAEERGTAEAAIREIGTNGLPAMLVWLRYDPIQTKNDTAEFLTRIQKFADERWVPLNLTYEHGVPPGFIGFNALGPAAVSAIPELALIANNPQQPRPAIRALMALSQIGPAALPAVEARLANTNFPFPSDAAVRIYLRTRTLKDEHQLSANIVRPILAELQANANPLLSKGATHLLQTMDLPSSQERGQTKSISEAMLDLRTERQFGTNLKTGWNIPEWAKLSPEQLHDASNAVHSAVTSPPALPKGDEPYPYPLQPGTAAWNYATVEERMRSVEIPKSWCEHASSWQLFRSAIGNPYFRAEFPIGDDIGQCYQATRLRTLSILQQVDTAPQFGTNVLRWLNELNLAKMESSNCDSLYVPCSLDYPIVWYMASLDSALDTLNVVARQRLYRLAVWDADYFLSRSDAKMASGPLGVIYALVKKPESFRGPLPSGAVLSPPSSNKSSSPGLPQRLAPNPPNLRSAVAEAKAALGLKERP